jgi:1,4-alpha-glucan branching enzyme
VDGAAGTAFALWAPNAKRVSVIGNFNSWDGRRNPMRVLGNSGVWELFIPGVGELDHYKFEIKALDGTVFEKSDPYGNFFEHRPSKSSLVYDINKYKWNDSEWVEKRKNNDPRQRPMSIYEVHLGSWKRKADEGDRFLSYVELADDLVPYAKKMGYTHIELMPPLEHPFDGSWGYQVVGYYAPTSRYGNPSEFMYFIDKCHQNGIGVFLDWVPAHFPKDAHGLARFDGTALYEHEDPRKGEHPHWGTLIFNYGRKEVKNFLIANAIYWIEKYHADGLRVDAVASMLYLDYGKEDGQWIPNIHGGRENYDAVEFLKHMNSVIAGRGENIMMIAEESTAWPGVSSPTEYGGLGFNLKWNMGWMNDFLQYISKDPIHRRYHHGNLTFSMVYAWTERFILVLSHDEVVHGKRSLIEKMPGDDWRRFANLRLTYGFMYTHPGKKLLFMGSEFAQYAEWTESKSLDWHLLENPNNKNMLKYSEDLNAVYKAHPALWTYDFDDRGFEWIDCNDADRSILSYIRKSEDETLVMVANFTPVPLTAHRVGVPKAGTYEEIFNSDASKYGGGGIVNSQKLESSKEPYNFRDNSIELKVPPLGITILKLT